MQVQKNKVKFENRKNILHFSHLKYVSALPPFLFKGVNMWEPENATAKDISLSYSFFHS